MAKIGPPKRFPTSKSDSTHRFSFAWKTVLAAARLCGDRHGWKSGAEGKEAWVEMGDRERRGEAKNGKKP